MILVWVEDISQICSPTLLFLSLHILYLLLSFAHSLLPPPLSLFLSLYPPFPIDLQPHSLPLSKHINIFADMPLGV